MSIANYSYWKRPKTEILLHQSIQIQIGLAQQKTSHYLARKRIPRTSIMSSSYAVEKLPWLVQLQNEIPTKRSTCLVVGSEFNFIIRVK